MNSSIYNPHYIECGSCHCLIDEKLLNLAPGLQIKKRVMPNQPYQDVLENYIHCPACEKEIHLGIARADIGESIRFAMALLEPEQQIKLVERIFGKDKEKL